LLGEEKKNPLKKSRSNIFLAAGFLCQESFISHHFSMIGGGKDE